jgi:hypothetical protein
LFAEAERITCTSNVNGEKDAAKEGNTHRKVGKRQVINKPT